MIHWQCSAFLEHCFVTPKRCSCPMIRLVFSCSATRNKFTFADWTDLCCLMSISALLIYWHFHQLRMMSPYQSSSQISTFQHLQIISVHWYPRLNTDEALLLFCQTWLFINYWAAEIIRTEQKLSSSIVAAKPQPQYLILINWFFFEFSRPYFIDGTNVGEGLFCMISAVKHIILYEPFFL